MKKRSILSGFILMIFLMGITSEVRAAVNKVTSIEFQEFSPSFPVYGTGNFFDYRLVITCDAGSEAGTTTVSLASGVLPQGVSYAFISNSLNVTNVDQITLPAFSPGGSIYIRFFTIGSSFCQNLTPKGITENISFQCTSNPANIISNMSFFEVRPKQLFINGLSIDDKQYDGTTSASLSGGVLSGVVCDDDVSFTSDPEFQTSDAGLNKTVFAHISITGADADNYYYFPTVITGNVLPREVTITVTSKSKCAGTSLPYANNEFTAVGMIAPDEVTEIFINCPQDFDVNAAPGQYPAVGSQADGNFLGINYHFNYVDGILTVNEVPTVVSTKDSSRCGMGTIAIEAEASEGVINWYQNMNGGLPLHTGNVYWISGLTQTTDYWAQAESNGCTSARVRVTATIEDCGQLNVASCGMQLNNMSDAIYSNPIAGATNYKYLITYPATGFTTVGVRGSADILFRLSWISNNPLKYGTTYNVRVAAYVDGAWRPYGNTCTVSTPATRIKAVHANTTLASISDAIYSEAVEGATNYRYRILRASDNVQVAISTRGAADNLFRFSWISGLISGTSYKVAVSAYVNGAWQDFGPTVTMTLPIVTSKLSDGSCGMALSTMSHPLYADAVNGATSYKFEIRKKSDNSFVTVSTTSGNMLRLSWVSGLQLNTQYAIRVSVYVNGAWSAYGLSCTVTTPPTMNIELNDEHAEQSIDKMQLEQEISVFPNPSSGNITIKGAPGNYQLVNELGQQILEIEIDEKGSTQLNDLKKGIYLLKGKNEIQRVVVF